MPDNTPPTIKRFLSDKKIIPGQWYWVDLSTVETIPDRKNLDRPLHHGENAVVIGPGCKERAGYTSCPWHAMCYAEINGKPVLSQRVTVLHEDHTLTEETQRSFVASIENQYGKISDRKPGYYYFTVSDDGKITECTANDVAFVREYYRLRRYTKAENAFDCSVKRVSTTVGGLILYEYLPNGVVKRRTDISPDSYGGDPDFYVQYIESFSGEEETSSLIPFSNRERIHEGTTRITDPAHKFWLNNMLR